MFQERIEKRNDARFGFGEGLAKGGEEIVVGRVVRPKGEDAAGMELGGETAQAVRLVKSAILFIEEVAR